MKTPPQNQALLSKKEQEITKTNKVPGWNTIIILSPLLKERFEKIKEWCMTEGDFKKPDNMGWEEVAFNYMLVTTERSLSEVDKT